MKKQSEEDINRAVMEAKENFMKMADNLSIVSYKALNPRSSEFEDPQDFFADFLKRHGCVLTDLPSER